jgi:copper chaperone
METIIFKTNMKCSGCIEKITPALNELAGKDHWTVDLQNPDKTLSVSSSTISGEDIKSAVENAGFKLERK